MPEKYKIKLRNISTVAASSTVTIELPVGPRYHQVLIAHSYTSASSVANLCTNISEVRILRNSRIQRIFSGTELRDLNLLNGTAFDVAAVVSDGTVIPIFFAEPWRDDEVDQDALAWKTYGWDSFQIQIVLSSGAGPTITACAIVDNVVPSDSSKTEAIVKVLRTNIGASGTQVDYTNLDRKDWLQQISLYPGTGAVAATEVTFRRGSEILHEMTAAYNKAILTTNKMTPAASGRTASIYDLVFDHDGLLTSAVNLNGARDTTLSITATTMTGTIVALIQRLGIPD